MTIATIPVGYFEGLDRRLSGKGVITLGNGIVSCPIIGRISMNISSIDVSDMSGIKNGDEVIVISNNRDAKNSIVNIAKDCETIPYDIAVKIPAHLKRVVID
jgi:alanine racemase